MPAESDIAARSMTAGGKSVRGQKVCLKGTGVNDFGSAAKRRSEFSSTALSTALEAVSAWHGVPLNLGVEG